MAGRQMAGNPGLLAVCPSGNRGGDCTRPLAGAAGCHSSLL